MVYDLGGGQPHGGRRSMTYGGGGQQHSGEVVCCTKEDMISRLNSLLFIADFYSSSYECFYFFFGEYL